MLRMAELGPASRTMLLAGRGNRAPETALARYMPKPGFEDPLTLVKAPPKASWVPSGLTAIDATRPPAMLKCKDVRAPLPIDTEASRLRATPLTAPKLPPNQILELVTATP